MTPLGEAVHERCKTGECSTTTATVCTTTVAAVVALLVLSGGLRLMGDHILSRPQDDASVHGETGEGGRGKGRVVKEGKQEGDGDREVEGGEKMET